MPDPAPTLNAQMPLVDVLAAAKASPRYHNDSDYHLLTDWVERLWNNVLDMQADIEAGRA